MFDPSVIFQRTHEGRTEIKQKSHGLTQSERLVLIMVDGVSTYQEVRNKLPSLVDDRFNRALRKLHQKELILEVFMPTAEDEAEHLEQDVIDRFLHQDALDPVTIIMFDPEDELGGISPPATSPYRKAPEKTAAPVQPAPILQAVPVPELSVGSGVAHKNPAAQQSMSTTASSERISAAGLPSPPKAEGAGALASAPIPPAPIPVARPEPVVALDDAHKEMVDLLAEEVRQRNLDRPARVTFRPEVQSPQFNIPQSRPPKPKNGLAKIHWGYWMMGLGSVFIVGYFFL